MTAERKRWNNYVARGPSVVLELSPYSAFFTTHLCRLGSRPNHTLKTEKRLAQTW